MKVWPIITVLICLNPLAFAGLGPNVFDLPHPKGLCLITLQQESGFRSEICSGFLKDGSTLVTAGHCTIKMSSQTDVQCGDQSVKVKNYEVAKNLNLESLEYYVGLRSADVAIVQLEKEISMESTLLIDNSEDIEGLLLHNPLCAFFGFSNQLGESISNKIPMAKAIQVNAEFLSTKQGVIHLDGTRGATALVQPGDSGGGLACWQKDHWVFFAVVSGRDWDYQSFFAPLYNHEQLNKINDSNIKFETSTEFREDVDLDFPIQIGQVIKLPKYIQFEKTNETNVTGFMNQEGLRNWPFEHSTLDHGRVFFQVKEAFDNDLYGDIVFESYTLNYSCLHGFVCSPGTMTRVRIEKKQLMQKSKTKWKAKDH